MGIQQRLAEFLQTVNDRALSKSDTNLVLRVSRLPAPWKKRDPGNEVANLTSSNRKYVNIKMLSVLISFMHVKGKTCLIQ